MGKAPTMLNSACVDVPAYGRLAMFLVAERVCALAMKGHEMHIKTESVLVRLRAKRIINRDCTCTGIHFDEFSERQNYLPYARNTGELGFKGRLDQLYHQFFFENVLACFSMGHCLLNRRFDKAPSMKIFIVWRLSEWFEFHHQTDTTAPFYLAWNDWEINLTTDHERRRL